VTSDPVLLIVCTANVCRSPLVESVLRRRLPETGGPLATAIVRSAGTRAVPGQPMCPVSGAESHDDAFEAAHSARLLDAELIGGADLVLTAEREHRGAAARLAPGSQARVFTFLEAIALAEVAAQRVRAGEADPPGDLAGVAAILHSSRGRVPVAEATQPPRGLFRRRERAPSVHPFDLADGHGQPPAEHEAAVRRTHELAERLITALTGLTGPRAGEG
jgi:protein-tyrosine phosphatase